MAHRVQPFFREAAADLRRALAPLIAYAALFWALSAAIPAPLASGLIGWMLSGSGRETVGNEEIVEFLLSPAGTAILLIGGGVFLAFLFAEYAGMILIAFGRRTSPGASVAGSILSVLRRLPSLLGLGMLIVGPIWRSRCPFFSWSG